MGGRKTDGVISPLELFSHGQPPHRESSPIFQGMLALETQGFVCRSCPSSHSPNWGGIHELSPSSPEFVSLINSVKRTTRARKPASSNLRRSSFSGVPFFLLFLFLFLLYRFLFSPTTKKTKNKKKKKKNKSFGRFVSVL